MSVDLSAADQAKLLVLGDILIPAERGRPAPSALPEVGDWLRRAIGASVHPGDILHQAVERLPPELDWERAKEFAGSDPEAFRVLAHIVSAAYFMHPVVLRLLGYPVEHRFPAGVEEFVDEFESGVFEPVLAMPSRYRDTR